MKKTRFVVKIIQKIETKARQITIHSNDIVDNAGIQLAKLLKEIHSDNKFASQAAKGQIARVRLSSRAWNSIGHVAQFVQNVALDVEGNLSA